MQGKNRLEGVSLTRRQTESPRKAERHLEEGERGWCNSVRWMLITTSESDSILSRNWALSKEDSDDSGDGEELSQREPMTVVMGRDSVNVSQ